MSIHINIPEEQETALRKAWGEDLDRAAREGLLIESYRTAKISLGYLAELLGLETSIEAQAWLAKRGIPLNYGPEDLEADRATAAILFPDFTP